MANMYCRALDKCRVELVQSMSGHIPFVTNSLHQHGLQKQPLLHKTKAERAALLLDFVKEKVEKEGQKFFEKFVKILQTEEYFKNVVDRLQDALLESDNGSIQFIEPPTPKITPPSGTRKLDYYIQYTNCHCENCSVEDFIEGTESVTCPASKSGNVGVYLQLTNGSSLTETINSQIRFTDYKLAIEEQAQLMQKEFNKLVQLTIEELRTNVELQTAICTLQNQLYHPGSDESLYSHIYMPNKQKRLELKHVKSYRKLSEYLISNFCSWFNISLIAHLREILLHKHRDDPLVMAYEKKLAHYLKKCCFRLVSGEIVCAVSSDFRTIRTSQRNRFSRKLQKILCISECEVKVENESGKLVFIVKGIQNRQLNPMSSSPPLISLFGVEDNLKAQTRRSSLNSQLSKDTISMEDHSKKDNSCGQKCYWAIHINRTASFLTCSIISFILLCFIVAVCTVFIPLLSSPFIDSNYQPVSINTTLLHSEESSGKLLLIATVNRTIQSDLTFTKLAVTDQDDQIKFYFGRCTEEVISEHREFYPRKSNVIDERFTFGASSTLAYTFDFRMLNDQQRSSTDCAAVLVTFDNHTDYLLFLTNGTWSNSYFEICIQNGSSFRAYISFTEMSDYYTGLFIPSPRSIIGRVRYRTEGSYIRYNSKHVLDACTILPTESSCIASLNASRSQDVCVFASVSSLAKRSGSSEDIMMYYINYEYTALFKNDRPPDQHNHLVPLYYILVGFILAFSLLTVISLVVCAYLLRTKHSDIFSTMP